jgi:hypothetical protein
VFAGAVVDDKRGKLGPPLLYQTDVDVANETIRHLVLLRNGRIAQLNTLNDLELSADELAAAERLRQVGRKRAIAMVEEHWHAIAKIAGVLLREKALSQAQIDEAIAAAL